MTRSLLALGRAAALGFVLCAVAVNDAAAFQVTPYGSGVNPPGSLVVTAGIPMVGATFTVGVSNTATASAPAALAFLSVATAPDPAFPAGTVLPGFGLAFPGSQGELLLSLASPNPFATLGPVPWAGSAAAPANFALSVPLLPSLSGLSIYLQGTLVDLVAGPSLGLTNGLHLTLSAPSFPGLVLIQPGTFQMGSDAPNGAPYFSEFGSAKPVHHVTISKSYWMGRHEVTQAQYQALMGTNPSFFLGADRPVGSVTWFQAVAFCDALNAQAAALGKVPEGYQYRLPTEAEWEYACRAGTTTEFHYGPSLLCHQERFLYSYHSASPLGCQNPSGTAPVGSYAPNAWGLYDMHGNVSEWCLDSFSVYTASAKTNPYVSDGWGKVVRGGSWYSSSDFCRSASRGDYFPRFAGNDGIGLRVVLAPILAP